MKTLEKTIGEIVANDYRTAEVFQSFGIDFCCKGNISIAEACENKKIDKTSLLSDLKKVGISTEKATDFNTFPLDLLAEYIEKKHHRYVDEKLPILKQYLEKICQVHGSHHPELFEIKNLFFESAGEFTTHMKKEELMLFPYIKKMAKAVAENKKIDAPHFGTVQNPIQMMMHDHESEGDRFQKIAELSNQYNPPADACNTYKVTFALLKEFEADLHIHIHLENNILFPKAIQMEQNIK